MSSLHSITWRPRFIGLPKMCSISILITYQQITISPSIILYTEDLPPLPISVLRVFKIQSTKKMQALLAFNVFSGLVEILSLILHISWLPSYTSISLR